MKHESSLRVVNCHDQPRAWPWIARLYGGEPQIEWHSVSTQRSQLISQLPGPHLGRVRAGLQVRSLLGREPVDLVVSHGPHTSFYVQALGSPHRKRVPHLAFAFNFTDLPTGYRLEAMQRAFKRVDRFVVYSTLERELYANLFGVPASRFSFVRWGVAPPLEAPMARTVPQPYVAAMGGEARDYETLCQAARLLPDLSFLLIARPHSLQGIIVPPNVSARFNLPWDEAWSLMHHAELALVPLRSGRTPNGHVTIVGSMHLGKPQVATDSAGIRDYLKDEDTALLVPPRDPCRLAEAVKRVLRDKALQDRLGSNAKAFAQRHCSEAVTVEAFRQLATEITSSSS